VEEWLDDGETVHGEVGRYRANPFGLHDMHGNVMEWCMGSRLLFTREPRSGDSAQPPKDDHRVVRGGSFSSFAKGSRSACRADIARTAAGANVGLRPILSLAH
jgi:formylglycine-generating enzyme required for sulfatase activity